MDEILENAIQKIEYGIDWITLTEVVDDGRASSLNLLWASLHEEGELPRRIGMGGYKGWRLQKKNIRVGSRSRDGLLDVILIGSGGSAEDVVRNVREMGIEGKCTRLDIQVTVILDKPDKNIAVYHYEQIKASIEAGESISGRRKPSLIRSDSGDTLYVGSRKTKSYFIRIYDKSLELGIELGRAWRFEIQYGRHAAGTVLQGILEHGRDEVKGLVRGIIKRNTGIYIPIRGSHVNKIPRKEDTDDIATTLRWLRSVVATTVSRLGAQGYMDEAIEALGLQRELFHVKHSRQQNSDQETEK